MTAEAVTHVDALLANSVRALRACLLSDDVPVSVFVDPTLTNTLSEEDPIRSALTQGTLTRVPLPIVHDDIAPDARPYLLHAPSEQKAERAIEHTMRVALSEAVAGSGPLTASRQVCAWIVGEIDPKTLANRLTMAAVIRKPDGEPRPFRYWDPRVMWHLPRAMESSRWAVLRATLGSWLTLDMEHQLRLVPTSEANGTSLEDSSMHAVSARCSQSQWAALARIGPTNVAMAQAMEWGMPPTLDLALQVDSLLQTCDAMGFDSQRDAQVFVACGLTCHAKFFENAEVHSALMLAQTAGQSVMSALENFDDSFWDELRSLASATRTHIP